MDPYALPEANVETATANNNEKKRGFWLTGFLVIMFIANPITAISNIASPDVTLMAAIFPNATTPIMMTLGVISLVNFGLAIGIWQWKKWGVYGFYASSIVVMGVNFYIGLGFAAFFGFLGPLSVYLLVRKKWLHFS